MNPGEAARRVATIAWPAFVGAGAIETFVFAFVEPSALHTLSGEALGLSATAIYSIAFLVFWAAVAAACAVALWLAGGGPREGGDTCEGVGTPSPLNGA